ncbi:hypothetical protein [Nonomuraea endophytica]|uniref:DUF4760 domain-containing protein n=1 Tax=Nonomuraea endophytica TaxID=714136 RepID=A0A7W8EJK5_9ACTN|nr:hypothetical protein [Nonomuraea endophytica]MBB5081611.1 hypothetical protein [Nonomuraea endophytica]
MNVGAAVTVSITVILALSGYLITYGISLRLARRKEHLEWVNRQLSEYYGPLYGLIQASDRIFRDLSSKHSFWGDGERLATEHETKVWRLWIEHAFMPLNRRMMEIVIGRADLLIEDHMPECLQELCAHVVGYEAMLVRWKEVGSFSPLRHDNASTPLFPGAALRAYISTSFLLLKKEQEQLIRRIR